MKTSFGLTESSTDQSTGWYDCLKQETAHLNIRSIIFELGFFRTNIIRPAHIKFRRNQITDYDGIRNMVGEFVHGMGGNQPGDPVKAVKVMMDIVRGEGVAEGKVVPQRLPLGPDTLGTMRKKAVTNLTICNEWEDVIRGTNIDQ
jgi:hypothetical protein